MPVGAASHSHAISIIVASCVAWKILLLVIAAASPGPGYDTSTQLLLGRHEAFDHPAAWIAHLVATKLTRWDAFYYVSTAARGYALFEQEWAFGWGMKELIHRVTAALSLSTSLVSHALVGICISHIAHLVSTLMLYALTVQMLPMARSKHEIALCAALLSVVTPAGMFLSAPYAEAPFAMTQFGGMLACALAWKPGKSMVQQSLLTILAGACFGLACTLRSNGIFSGLVFVEPFLLACSASTRRFSVRALGQTIAPSIAGLLTIGGLLLPQYIAYQEYCTLGQPRPWCSRFLPSVYTWVQSHYWGVGFLNYWTLSNLPLFLIATPMLVVLISTALMAIDAKAIISQVSTKPDQNIRYSVACMRRFALPQLVLAILAMTNFHVQIVNRISSGYPVWYIVLALAVHGVRSGRTSLPGLTASRLQCIIRATVMYSLIQGGLYASFLPPA